MTLKEELTEIQGVGDATADKILDVVGENGVSDAELRRVRDALERGSVDVAKGRIDALLESE